MPESKSAKKDSKTPKKNSKKSKTPSIRVTQLRELLDDSGSARSERRVLVDRLWPRGIKKERLAHDDWNKDVAPSPDLRKAFHGGDLDFDEFRDHYLRELSESEAAQQLLESAAKAEATTIVLVYGAKDAEHNHAQVLAEHLRTLSTS